MNEVVDYNGILVMCRSNSTDRDIAMCIIGRGEILSDEYHLRALAKTGATLVDVGAYGGHASLLAAQLGMKAIAIEPLPANVENIIQNIALNNMKESIHLYEGAIGCNTICWNGKENDFAIRHRFVAGGTNSDGEEIKVKRLNLDIILDHVESIHILKTDCEGGEWELPNFPKTMAKTKYIVGEFHAHRTFVEFKKAFPDFTDVSEEFGDKHTDSLRMFVFRHKSVLGC